MTEGTGCMEGKDSPFLLLLPHVVEYRKTHKDVRKHQHRGGVVWSVDSQLPLLHLPCAKKRQGTSFVPIPHTNYY